MRLKRPTITPGPWVSDLQNGFPHIHTECNDGREHSFHVADFEHSPNAERAANMQAAAALPEVMTYLEEFRDQLEYITIHDKLPKGTCFADLFTFCEDIMLKMGYTEEGEGGE